MCDLELKLNLNKLVSSCFASCSILHLHESTIVNIYIYLDRLGLSHTYVVFVDCYVVFCCNMYICIRNGLRLNLLRRTILRKYLKISFQEPQFYILLYQYNKLYFKFVHLSYDPWSKSRAHSQHNGFILMCSKLKSLKPYPTNGVSEFVDKGYPRNQRTLRNHEY